MKKIYGIDLKVFANKGNEGCPNEKKYIIDAKWWRKWCDYTGFETNDIIIENRYSPPKEKS